MLQLYKISSLFCTVSEDNLQKNISQLSKSVKQMEIDIKNAQQDKSAPSNDRFLHVMTISFSACVTNCFAHCLVWASSFTIPAGTYSINACTVKQFGLLICFVLIFMFCTIAEISANITEHGVSTSGMNHSSHVDCKFLWEVANFLTFHPIETLHIGHR